MPEVPDQCDLCRGIQNYEFEIRENCIVSFNLFNLVNSCVKYEPITCVICPMSYKLITASIVRCKRSSAMGPYLQCALSG